MTKSRFHFTPLQIPNSFGIKLEQKNDERGSLTRIWDSNLFLDKFEVNQISVVNNPVKYTLRGLHFQKAPFTENKIIYCIDGTVFDVLVDLRVKSRNYLQHLEFEIGPDCKYQGILIPAGCGHGYLTLNSNSKLVYFMDSYFSEASSSGIKWDDPQLQINWPKYPSLVSVRDSKLPYIRDLISANNSII
jgi:dTDP-4-dehydrorhamnose 3,5-epimerase